MAPSAARGSVGAVLLVGLTGGIGSGKSSVARLLEARGARVIDADRITRQLQQPGTRVFEAMVDRFGAGIVGPDGALDRGAVAEIVFADGAALADLNAIVHPAVGVEIGAQIAAAQDSDDIVVLDVPLLVETGREGLAATLVVDVDPELAIARLVEHRGFDEADARARIAAQATRDERLARATHVLDNSGDLEALEARVDEVWHDLEALTAGGGHPER